jgi:hypothetical protein
LLQNAKIAQIIRIVKKLKNVTNFIGIKLKDSTKARKGASGFHG